VFAAPLIFSLLAIAALTAVCDESTVERNAAARSTKLRRLHFSNRGNSRGYPEG